MLTRTKKPRKARPFVPYPNEPFVPQPTVIPGVEGDGVLDFFFPTRQNFPPKVREIVKKYADKKIRSIAVGRKPVQRMVTNIFDWLSNGKFYEQVKKLKYDDMYHLFMLVELADGTTLLVEKNSVVNMKPENPHFGGMDKMSVPVTKDITFGQMVDNAVKAVGKSLYLYDLSVNNCQKFITDLLKNSGLLTPALDTFINQDVESVIKATPSFAQKIANAATETSAKINRFFHGEGRKKRSTNRQRYLY